MRHAVWLLGLVACAGGGSDDPDVFVPPDVFINEFLASNATTLADETGSYPDWVELYNAGDAAVDLSGYGFTDDLALPSKWVLPAGTQIAAGGFLVVFCDGDVDDGPLHANFSLALAGEAIGLYGPANLGSAPIDEIDAYEAQTTDVSMARSPDGGADWVAATTPTPGGPNL